MIRCTHLLTMTFAGFVGFVATAGQASDITMQITSLDSSPRAKANIEYKVEVGNPDNLSDRRPIVWRVVNGVNQTEEGAVTNDYGMFSIHIPQDQYFPNSNAIFLTINGEHDDDGDGSPNALDEVKLDFLDGTADQRVSVIMMRATRRPVYETTEIEQYALQGAHGSYHVLGTEGTLFYVSPSGRSSWLAAIESVKSDARFDYFREVDDPRRLWAISRVAPLVCHNHCCDCCCARPVYSIWFRKSNGKWRRVDTAKRYSPINRYTTETVAKYVD